jgi:hypothetical protein
MALANGMRGFRALIASLVCAVAALAPAAADAATNTGLGDQFELAPATQLAAMNTALKAAPGFFAGRSSGCVRITPVLASQPGMIMAGNFRDMDGGCYVWLNLQQSDALTGSEICKTTLHEYGHLTGLEHSSDPQDVMFAPFQPDGIPAPCQVQPAGSSAKAPRAVSVCPPGAKNADYCQTVVAKKKRTTRRK